MAVVIGRFQPLKETVSVVSTVTGRQLQFDSPADFALRILQNPNWHPELLSGEWVWTTQPVQGGH